MTSDESVLVSAGNSSTLVAAVGKPDEDLTIHTYVTAKNFTMSSLSVAAVACDSEKTGCYGNLTSLTDRASTLVDGLTNVGSQRNP